MRQKVEPQPSSPKVYDDAVRRGKTSSAVLETLPEKHQGVTSADSLHVTEGSTNLVCAVALLNLVGMLTPGDRVPAIYKIASSIATVCLSPR